MQKKIRDTGFSIQSIIKLLTAQYEDEKGEFEADGIFKSFMLMITTAQWAEALLSV